MSPTGVATGSHPAGFGPAHGPRQWAGGGRAVGDDATAPGRTRLRARPAIARVTRVVPGPGVGAGAFGEAVMARAQSAYRTSYMSWRPSPSPNFAPSPLAEEGWDGGEQRGLGTPPNLTPTLTLPRRGGADTLEPWQQQLYRTLLTPSRRE